MTPEQQEIPLRLDSFGQEISAGIVGATGGLGGAFVDLLTASANVSQVLAFSRSKGRFASHKVREIAIDVEDDDSIGKAAAVAAEIGRPFHIFIVASGVLHDGTDLQPEKTWKALSPSALEHAFRLNATGPALVAKHFLPLLAKDRKSAFAALSARVGSIGDNQLGGWHAYRASKAALNMLLKTLSIELARRNPEALCVGLHPGTVDTALSKPFQGGLPQSKLFTTVRSARNLLSVLNRLSPEDSGYLHAWDGNRIPF